MTVRQISADIQPCQPPVLASWRYFTKIGITFALTALTLSSSACVSALTLLDGDLKWGDVDLMPVYLGDAQNGNYPCEGYRSFVWIYGPDELRIRVGAQYYRWSDDLLLVLQAVTLDGQGMQPPATQISITDMTKGTTTTAEAVKVVNVTLSSVVEVDAIWQVRFLLANGVKSTYRINLPVVATAKTRWEPGLVEMRPVDEDFRKKYPFCYNLKRSRNPT